MSKFASLIAVFSFVALGACAHNQKDHDHSDHHGHKHHHKKKWKKKWNKMDTNQDGAVSLEEWNNYHAEKFKKMDADGDGKVTMEEKKAYKKAKREKKMNKSS